MPSESSLAYDRSLKFVEMSVIDMVKFRNINGLDIFSKFNMAILEEMTYFNENVNKNKVFKKGARKQTHQNWSFSVN